MCVAGQSASNARVAFVASRPYVCAVDEVCKTPRPSGPHHGNCEVGRARHKKAPLSSTPRRGLAGGLPTFVFTPPPCPGRATYLRSALGRHHSRQPPQVPAGGA
jgi:hypothetical protein